MDQADLLASTLSKVKALHTSCTTPIGYSRPRYEVKCEELDHVKMDPQNQWKLLEEGNAEKTLLKEKCLFVM